MIELINPIMAAFMIVIALVILVFAIWLVIKDKKMSTLGKLGWLIAIVFTGFGMFIYFIVRILRIKNKNLRVGLLTLMGIIFILSIIFYFVDVVI